MKRSFLFITILVIGLFSLTLFDAYGFDWRQAESGRYNITLEGYKGQPGYVSFQDSGSHQGVLFAHDKRLYWYMGPTETSDLETICDGGDDALTHCRPISFDF